MNYFLPRTVGLRPGVIDKKLSSVGVEPRPDLPAIVEAFGPSRGVAYFEVDPQYFVEYSFMGESRYDIDFGAVSRET